VLSLEAVGTHSHFNDHMQSNTICLQTLWSSASHWRQLSHPRTSYPEHMSVMFSHMQMRACKTTSISFAWSVAIPWALALHNSGLTHCSSGLILPSRLMDEEKSSPHALLPHFLWLFQSVYSLNLTLCLQFQRRFYFVLWL